MFKTEYIDEIYINYPLGTYTFTDIIDYVRNNIHLWEKSHLIWDNSEFHLSRDAEPSKMIKQQLSQSMDLAKRRSGKRTAFVASDDFGYGMFRMYCIFTQCLDFPFEMEAFRTIEEAKDWIKNNY